jgi:hypothetical protein
MRNLTEFTDTELFHYLWILDNNKIEIWTKDEKQTHFHLIKSVKQDKQAKWEEERQEILDILQSRNAKSPNVFDKNLVEELRLECAHLQIS